MSEEESEALIADCEQRLASGLDLVPIVVRRAKPPTGLRCRVLPGLTGEVSCWHEDGRLVAYVSAAKLRALLLAARQKPATPTVTRKESR